MTPPSIPALLAEEERLLTDFRRVALRAERFLRGPDCPATRLALVDDLLAVRRRLRAARQAVRAGIHRTSTARTAVSAYRRVGALR